MIKFVNISALKNGKNKYSFSQLGICKILKEELDFRFVKISKRGYYLSKNDANGYDIVNFSKLSEAFLNYCKQEFDGIETLNGTSYVDLENAFYSKNPLKNNDYCSEFLSKDFELDSDSFHKLSLDVDKVYKYKFDLKKMFSFLKNEGFKIVKESHKKYRYDELFCYKQISDDEFMIFHREFTNRDKNESHFNCWLFDASSEDDFMRSKMDFFRKEQLKAQFNPELDMELYNKTK